MKKKFPNASILTLITQTDGSNENLLFIYLKTIPDFYPSNRIYWYDGAGKDGKPNNVWEKLSIKQWTACCKDSILTNLFDSILATNSIEIDGKKINLSISPFKLNSNSADPMRSRRETIFDTLITESNTLIPQEFYQKENLQFLSAYKTGSSEIKPLFPLGFFEDNFIHENLKKGIWGIKEYRTAYLTFQGVRKTSTKGIGSKEMVGFYQQNFNSNSEYIVVVKNESQQEIGKGSINKKTGFFKINLCKPTQKGIVEVLIDSKEEKAIEYTLIQEIKINTNIAESTFQDAYGRNSMITSDKKERPKSITSFTWQQSVYADEKEANQKLSDLFKLIFDYLGPNIVIADPYYFGEIKQDDVTAEMYLKNDQIAFINAMTHSALEKGIDKINFLGYWARARNQLATDWFSKYEKFFKRYILLNKLEKFFPSSSIRFYNSKTEFHPRYWFSLVDQDGIEVLDKCVILTNSIGNMSELDIIPITDESQLRQITRKYTGLFNNSQSRLSI